MAQLRIGSIGTQTPDVEDTPLSLPEGYTRGHSGELMPNQELDDFIHSPTDDEVQLGAWGDVSENVGETSAGLMNQQPCEFHVWSCIFCSHQAFSAAVLPDGTFNRSLFNNLAVYDPPFGEWSS